MREWNEPLIWRCQQFGWECCSVWWEEVSAKGSGQTRLMGRDQLQEVQQGKVKGPALSSQPHGVLQAGRKVAGKLPWIKSLVGVSQ